MAQKRYLAFDLGAESGRAIVGTLDGRQLSLEEIHRFLNQPVRIGGTLHWDFLSLYREILTGMKTYVERCGSSVDGMGVDTWGVDFGLLAADGSLLQNPVHYRDARTEGIPDELNKIMPLEQVFARTGIWTLPIYTLSQMFALRSRKSPILDAAATFLMMPDLFHYFLTGVKACERTDAITTELYDPRSGQWHEEVFRTFDLPLDIMPELVDPGTVLGELRQSVKDETGLTSAPVIAPCGHDTAAAVAAVPGRGDDWAFISSGTWSCAGALCDDVVTTKEAHDARCCNELTIGSFFLCRNIMGLWLLQQARAAWSRAGDEYSYGDLVKLAEQAADFDSMVDPDDEGFLAPDDMPAAIRDFCRRTGQPAPEGAAQITRCILESLALSYRHALDQFAELLGRTFSVLHIVGGGSLNTLLCQLTADATGMAVLAGPVETTVVGNILTQALATGHLDSPQDIRDVVRESWKPVEYAPQGTAVWDGRYAKYLELLEKVRQ